MPSAPFSKRLSFSLPTLLLASLPACGFAQQVVMEQRVDPGAAYRLSFNAKAATGGWSVYLRDTAGRLPYDGTLSGDWQKLSDGTLHYSHVFYTPDDAATLQLIRHESGSVFENVKLTRIEEPNLVLNPDFAEGNLSGWTEIYNAELQEEADKPLLFVHQNGYALTDYLPVAEDKSYAMKSQQGIHGVAILAYDANRHLLGPIPQTTNERLQSVHFKLPQGTRWLRLLYQTGHSHLPAWRVNPIRHASLWAVDDLAPSKQVVIQDDPAWEIVLPTGSDARELHAARELRYWMHAITGKAPALLSEPSPLKSRKIFLGRSAGKTFPADMKALEDSDGFAIRTKAENLYIFGPHERSTLYGVYALLEQNTDIIWPRPNAEFEAFYSKSPSIDFKQADTLSRPAFKYRLLSHGTADEAKHQVWHGRGGLNSPIHLHKGNNYRAWLNGAMLGFSGSYAMWAKEASEKDERIYPLIEGKRDTSIWRQPCYTYPGTAQAIATEIRKAITTLPGRETEYVHTSIADNWMVCGCPSCMEPITLPEGGQLKAKIADSSKEARFFSTRNFMMLNDVAAYLEKTGPLPPLMTHAYIFTAEPPAVKIHPTIIPEFAAYPTQNIRYPIHAGAGQVLSFYTKNLWKERFEVWGESYKGRLGYFGYYYTPGFNALADTAALDYRDLKKYEAALGHTEGFPPDDEQISTWDADAMEKWIIAKLLWNPELDPAELRKEYIRRVYRGAEKEMSEFYAIIHKAWHGAPPSVFINCHSTGRELFQNLIVTPGIEKTARDLLVAAGKSASNEQTRKLISRHLAYFDEAASSLGRHMVPHVEESMNEWNEFTSPHWEKATYFGDFRKVDTWQRFDQKPATHATRVGIMHDRTNLYFRFTGSLTDISAPIEQLTGESFPMGERFEIILNGNRRHYIAVGPSGNLFSLPSLHQSVRLKIHRESTSWTAMILIPLALVQDSKAPETLEIKLGRVSTSLNGEEESSHNGYSLFDPHKSYWLNLQIIR